MTGDDVTDGPPGVPLAWGFEPSTGRTLSPEASARVLAAWADSDRSRARAAAEARTAVIG